MFAPELCAAHLAAKTAEPHPKLPGTIYTAAEEIKKAGGKALPVICDIRDEAQVADAVAKTVGKFGGIDICVNNASAIQLTGTLETDMKRFDLMHQINTRGTFLVSKTCIPHLKKAANPHILMLSPPLDMKAKWFEHSTAYTMAKFGMSMCVLGLSGELKSAGVAVNALWPRTTIATAAVGNLLGGDAMMRASRTPEGVATLAIRESAPASSAEQPGAPEPGGRSHSCPLSAVHSTSRATSTRPTTPSLPSRTTATPACGSAAPTCSSTRWPARSSSRR